MSENQKYNRESGFFRLYREHPRRIRKAFKDHDSTYRPIHLDELIAVNYAIDINDIYQVYWNKLGSLGFDNPNIKLNMQSLVRELIGEVTCSVLDNPIMPELDYLTDSICSLLIDEDMEYNSDFIVSANYLSTLSVINENSIYNANTGYGFVGAVYEIFSQSLAEQLYLILPLIQSKILSQLNHFKFGNNPFYLDYQINGLHKSTMGYWFHVAHCYDIDIFSYHCESIEDPFPNEMRSLVQIDKYFTPYNGNY